MSNCTVRSKKNAKEYKSSRYKEQIQTETAPRKSKPPLPRARDEIQIFLERAQPWLSKWQRAHCSDMPVGIPPSGTCWKSTLLGAGENCSWGSVLSGVLHDKAARKMIPGELQATGCCCWQPWAIGIGCWRSCLHCGSLLSKHTQAKVKVLVAQLCPPLCDPWIVAHQASLSMGFSR